MTSAPAPLRPMGRSVRLGGPRRHLRSRLCHRRRPRPSSRPRPLAPRPRSARGERSLRSRAPGPMKTQSPARPASKMFGVLELAALADLHVQPDVQRAAEPCVLSDHGAAAELRPLPDRGSLSEPGTLLDVGKMRDEGARRYGHSSLERCLAESERHSGDQHGQGVSISTPRRLR